MHDIPNFRQRIKSKCFWLWIIASLIITALFIGLIFLMIHLQTVKSNYQHHIYKKVNVTITGYSAVEVKCGCSSCHNLDEDGPQEQSSHNKSSHNKSSHNRSFPIDDRTYIPSCSCVPSPYTAVIALRYNVSNYSYHDEKRVNCGSSYINAVDNAKKDYPEDKKIIMYYDSKDPGAGVVFYINYDGFYWIGSCIFFICGCISLGVAITILCYDYPKFRRSRYTAITLG